MGASARKQPGDRLCAAAQRPKTERLAIRPSTFKGTAAGYNNERQHGKRHAVLKLEVAALSQPPGGAGGQGEQRCDEVDAVRLHVAQRITYTSGNSTIHSRSTMCQNTAPDSGPLRLAGK